jgi:hypothetical protein
LRFLVLDELHTYDGAQGADVACLVRRIKARLDVPEGGLCCVGTSATVAGGREEEEMDPLQRLAEFAGILFQESFTPAMIINEDNNRLDIAAMVVPEPEAPEAFPSASDCMPRDDETAAAFAQRVAPLWGAPEFPLMAGNPWLDCKIQRPAPEKYWGLADAGPRNPWRRHHGPASENLHKPGHQLSALMAKSKAARSRCSPAISGRLGCERRTRRRGPADNARSDRRWWLRD